MPKYSESEEAGMAEGSPTPDDASMDQAQEPSGDENEHSLFISPEHLGPLDPNDINPGDILEFKVVGKDAEGDIEVVYNTGNDKASSMDKMKSDLADHMSSSLEGEPGAGSNY